MLLGVYLLGLVVVKFRPRGEVRKDSNVLLWHVNSSTLCGNAKQVQYGHLIVGEGIRERERDPARKGIQAHVFEAPLVRQGRGVPHSALRSIETDPSCLFHVEEPGCDQRLPYLEKHRPLVGNNQNVLLLHLTGKAQWFQKRGPQEGIKRLEHVTLILVILVPRFLTLDGAIDRETTTRAAVGGINHVAHITNVGKYDFAKKTIHGEALGVTCVFSGKAAFKVLDFVARAFHDAARDFSIDVGTVATLWNGGDGNQFGRRHVQ